MRSKVILIAGGTASGKTTIVEELLRHYKAYDPALLPLDSYYYPLTHLSYAERDLLNFDHPGAFEIDLLQQQLQSLLNNIAVQIPEYDYTIHDRVPPGKKVMPSKLIFVEGILALHFPTLREVASYGIFVETADDLRLARRTERDMAERGRTKASVESWWDEKVQPMYLQFCEPSKEYADLVVSGEIATEDALQIITGKLSAFVNC